MKKDQAILEVYNKLYREFGPRHWWPAETSFEVMVGAVLTQNTSWTNVEKAIFNLKKKKLLEAGKLDRIPHRKLAGLIKPAGYFNVKAKRLKSLAGFLISEFEGDLASMRRQGLDMLSKKLLSVHGIGPETRDSILLYALGKPVFVIDAYTKRIFYRLGLTPEGATYDDLQRFFISSLPNSAKLYNEYHALIVQLGKEICRKIPRCGLCPLVKLCKKRGLAF